MGIKDLWSILTPYCERKPINELCGKKVAIDLAGWVCESLNAVDYFVHPKQHLKNLFFRTCYLMWEDVMPVFVLDGAAPKLKSKTMLKRNEVNFRGVKPKEKNANTAVNSAKPKGRSHFNHTLEQCKSMLQCMGIHCIQAPGEAEAYCALLNKKGLVDGIISQDSDCFAYGALCVFRNFSISMQGKVAAYGGAIDIYDVQHIYTKSGLGQKKFITMALLCGCDYCPDGIDGIGRDSVLKLFKKYDDNEVLDRIRSWRSKDGYYNALEMRVHDKTICTNCGHIGRQQSHNKNGCDICRTNQGCDATLWREERDILKAELQLRKKALIVPSFPNEEIISEFLNEPAIVPDLKLNWKQPNISIFIRKFGCILQWPEIYSFQKFLPIVTRWQLRNSNQSHLFIVEPTKIVKKRIIRGVPSLEIIWQGKNSSIHQLIPEEQILQFENENSKTRQDLWTTVEPFNLVEKTYFELIATFINSIEAKKNEKQNSRKCSKKKKDNIVTIDNFFRNRTNPFNGSVSTPVKKQRNQNYPIDSYFPSDFESDSENLDISNIINDIVKEKVSSRLCHIPRSALSRCIQIDDNDVMVENRKALIQSDNDSSPISLDDSFDVLMKNGTNRLEYLNNLKGKTSEENNQNKNLLYDYNAFEMALDISQGHITLQ